MIIGFVADNEQKLDVAEGDIFKDIQEALMEAISAIILEVMSRVMAEAKV